MHKTLLKTYVETISYSVGSSSMKAPLDAGHMPPKPKHDIYDSIKPLIVFGRLASIIPCNLSNYRSYKKLQFKISALPVLISILLTCWTLTDTILGFNMVLKKTSNTNKGPVGYVLFSNFAMNSLTSSFFYAYFIRYSDNLFELLKKMKTVGSRIGLEKDTRLVYVSMLLIAFMIPATSISIIFVIDCIHPLTDQGTSGREIPANSSNLEMFYENEFFTWNVFVPYNAVFVIMHLIILTYIALPRVYVQALIIFFSRALSFQFKKLIENATNTKISQIYFVDLKNKDKKFWKDLVYKHENLCLLVKTVNEFLSPLIFVTTALSIYVICIQLFRALSGQNAIGVSTFVFTTSTIVEVGQYYLTIGSATKINVYATRILDILRKCPKDYYHQTEVSRVEHQVSSGLSIAFTGLGWYYLTKQFLLKIINAVFTIEIVLLQTSPASSKPETKSLMTDSSYMETEIRAFENGDVN